MENKTQPGQLKSINQALELLNDASKESADEIKNMINKDYKRMKEVLVEMKPALENTAIDIRNSAVDSMNNAREVISKKTEEAAQQINSSAHTNPWYFIGGAAGLAAIVGFLLGRKSK